MKFAYVISDTVKDINVFIVDTECDPRNNCTQLRNVQLEFINRMKNADCKGKTECFDNQMKVNYRSVHAIFSKQKINS